MTEAAQGGEPKPSLRDQLAAQLDAEQANAPEEPEEGPTPETEDEDVVEDGEDNATETDANEDSELEDDESTDEDEPGEGEEADEYKAKYEELEKEYRRVTANRKQIEEDFSQGIETNVKTQHELEDALTQAKQSADFFAQRAAQRVQQFQNLNIAALPAEQQQAARTQAQQAWQEHQQLQQYTAQLQEQQEQTKKQARKRQAEVTNAILRTRIPNWGEERNEALSKLALEKGFKQEELADITDHRVILLLNEVYENQKAAQTVDQSIKQRKAKPPKSRAGKQPARNAKGQYEKAQKDFKSGKAPLRAVLKAQLDAEDSR